MAGALLIEPCNVGEHSDLTACQARWLVGAAPFLGIN